MTALLDGLIATGATFEAVANEACALGYRLTEGSQSPPKSGTIFVDQYGNLNRVRACFLGCILCVDGSSKVRFFHWQSIVVGSLILEPQQKHRSFSVHWFALILVVVSRLFLLVLVSMSTDLESVALIPLWILTSLIIVSATYTSITLIHRAQWSGLALALDAMAPDWIPRLSRDVGGKMHAFGTVLGALMLHAALGLSDVVWVILLGFLFLDLMPTRHFQQARALIRSPKISVQGTPDGLVKQLGKIIRTRGDGVHVLTTVAPEVMLLAAEELVRNGSPITVLGPEAEFLPGTLRTNFAWDSSEVGEYHFSNLMEIVGIARWDIRFGGSLEYRIGPNNRGLSSSEAACLQIARALAQGAETLILVDALAPLAAVRQREILDRVVGSGCRVFVYSSVSDLWGDDVISLD
ncbi:hypothetical protein N8Z80_06760 [Litorivicinus sp.]|jgi:hypothetical protein|nr:hypothetical protein [Litorivicinus sp.]MDC1240713.1 hypothetical protein [Litorivicinus sp.]|tara:strand:+ start:34014 stop:35240 length:1227 start_codon:yes stop_codon:yes gene_type:complete